MELIAKNDRDKEKAGQEQQKQKSDALKCELCGKRIVKNTWNKKYRVVNICQEPPKRYFCSYKCKLRWIFKDE